MARPALTFSSNHTMVLPERRREVQISLPPVEEGLYDLRANGIAHQVVDSIEVGSPERAKKGFLFFFEGVALVVTGCVFNHSVEVCGRKAC